MVMYYILIAFLFVFAAAWIDVLVKELYVKKKLYLQKYSGDWSRVPAFWRDMIPNDRWHRIRWAIVLNAAFMVLAGIAVMDWRVSALYLFLAAINWEHICYQWIAGFFVSDKKLFDLTDNPGWMEGLPWNKWIARYHCKAVVTSEEIYTVAILGTVFICLASTVAW